MHNEKNKKIKVKVMERKIKVKNINMNRTPKIKLNGRYNHVHVVPMDDRRRYAVTVGLRSIILGGEGEMDVKYFNEVGERSRPRTRTKRTLNKKKCR